jgi:hypothetical protein
VPFPRIRKCRWLCIQCIHVCSAVSMLVGKAIELCETLCKQCASRLATKMGQSRGQKAESAIDSCYRNYIVCVTPKPADQSVQDDPPNSMHCVGYKKQLQAGMQHRPAYTSTIKQQSTRKEVKVN